MSEAAVKFSLVLGTLGRRDEVAAYCDSLLRQNRDDYELILVDQNADDRLDSIAAAYAGRFPLRHVKAAGTRGPSRARNAGLKLARGQIVGFPDDDCAYFDGYLDAVSGLFADPTLGGITGFPNSGSARTLPADWTAGAMPLDRVKLLNRCQEFTMFVRRSALGGVWFNERLGVGAGTPWGAEEGPDFLIRIIERGAKVVFYPRLFVYHPDKIKSVNPQIVARAAGYARGRGAYFRLHRHPVGVVARSLVRPAIGAMLYAVRGDWGRSKYYRTIVGGILRGMAMSRAELAELRGPPPRPGEGVAHV